MPPTHQVASGPAEIEKFFAGLFANGVTGHKLEMVDAGGDDKIVFGTAKRSATGRRQGGKPSLSVAWRRTSSNAKPMDPSN